MAYFSFNLIVFALLSFIWIMLLSKTCLAQPLCHHDERAALLLFKQSFLIRNFASIDPASYPKTASWANQNKSSDCCLWDGIECDVVSGYIIALDLSSSYLYGSIDSSCSLFSLIHLQLLNLGDNHFNFSQIPLELSRLTRLMYLNLSQSVFSGKIPPEIAEFSNLISLDLGGDTKGLLKLDASIIERLVQISKGLEILKLNSIQVLSTLPYSLGNLSSLLYLNLKNCQLSGRIPFSLGDLTNLVYLNLAANNLSGQIPSSLSNLTQLSELYLSNNNFSAGKLSWLGKQNRLEILELVNTNLGGEIRTLRNLTHLTKLYLDENKLIGEISSWLPNLTQLSVIRLNDNQLHGQVPEAISKLSKLECLDLVSNYFSGTLEFDIFSGLESLNTLLLDYNNLSMTTGIKENVSLPKFQLLGLGDCNLRKFPEFLRHQDQLIYLKMDQNTIQGQVPKWIGNMSTETLSELILNDNLLTRFEQPNVLSNLTNLQFLMVDKNRFEGPLPIPASTVTIYSIYDNSLSGKIPSSFCNLHSLKIVDLSYNNLSGKLPQCLGNLSVSLLAMSFEGNSFHGNIPNMFTSESRLQIIDLGYNKLADRVPRSLANCSMLQVLDISENNISDEFPFWLGTLPKLEILMLRSNNFFGTLRSPATMFRFPKLRILDLSSNCFTGILPSEFFQMLSNMKANERGRFTYMTVNESYHVSGFIMVDFFAYEMNLTNKGISETYDQVSNIISAIDLSSNKFQGEIPKSLTMLLKVNVLNLSDNSFSGHIPTALANMKNLESLDLSLNNFSGEIPPQLTNLTFLAYFNVSGNQLEGVIPRGEQFNTFDNSSYMDNSKLCGDPLTKKCNPVSSPDLTPKRDEESNSLFNFGWKVVVIGYGAGLVVGIAAGHRFTIWKHAWLMKTFRIKQPTRERRGRNRVVMARRS